MELAHTKKPSKLSFTIKRFVNFMKQLLKNKKSAFGLSIIFFFIFLAVAAPYLTPYDARGVDPSEPLVPLCAPNVAPTWLRFLPTWLGGNPQLSENMRVVNNPGRPSLKELKLEWSGEGTVSSYVDENVGYPLMAPTGFSKFTQNGSLVIVYNRKTGEPHNLTKVWLYAEFDWPYTGPPGRFLGNICILVNGTTKPDGKLDVPLKVKVYLGKADEKLWTLWPNPTVFGLTNMPIGFKEDPNLRVYDPKTGLILARFPWGIEKPLSGWPDINGWIISRSSPESKVGSIDSESNSVVNEYTEFGKNSFPHRMIFTGPGKYVYGLELTFLDQDSAEKDVETKVFVDDFGLLIFGTSFGLLGTDHQGRDLFSQLIYGTRISLYIGILVSVFSVFIGLIVGLAAGYLGRFVDEILMRITDLLLVLPGLPLLIVLVAVLGAKLENLIILLGVLGWMGFARMVRSQVLSIKERPFVEAAKAIGAGRFHIIVHHVLPSVMSLVYVSLATSVPGAITAEAALAWLGFYDPSRMSWGQMLHNVFESNAITNWWWVIPPGLCISLLAAAFILLGYALDEVLNPKLRLRR